ncbi:RNA polymerase sigma factor [Psychroflexus aestuariivivens]|uniref:RNA polymerase sigma factor n=1 Tax=Psychroflexus aestuariivivens TaxID=1795040 RepID=UPI000FD707C9|nr:sigma-70 family RNA polymerase sigma factor [Psychroflexus aestuariivivens]
MSKLENKESEFIKLVSESQGIIHKVCRLYCDDHTHREDLFQEIILQLWKSYPSFKGNSKFSSWMYRVGLNVAIQDFRKEKKRKYLFLESLEVKEPSISPKNNDKDERINALYKAISKLDKIEKAIMMLYLDEVPNEDIAEIIGISQNYVRVKMTRIRTKLANDIKIN